MTEKGIKGLTVTFDSFDEVVVQEFKDIIQGLLKDPWSHAHDYKETLKVVDGFLLTVSWYTTYQHFKEYGQSIQEDYDHLVNLACPKDSVGDLDIQITDIRDLPDGSANIEYEASPKMKEFLMGVGLRKILMDAVDEAQEEGTTEGVGYTDVPGWEYWDDWPDMTPFKGNYKGILY